MKNIMKYIDNAVDLAFIGNVLPNSETLLIPQVMRNAEYLTEVLIRRIWDYNKERNPLISGGDENRMIFRICAWAGIYTTNSYFKEGIIEDEDIIIADIERGGFDSVAENVCAKINHPTSDIQRLNKVFTSVSVETFNTLYYDNLGYFGGKKNEAQWETIKETALILFYIGMIYERHRSADKFPKRPMNWWE